MRGAGRGQNWRLESLKCFDELLERRSGIGEEGEHRPRQAREELKKLGGRWGLRSSSWHGGRQSFDSATWLCRAGSQAEGILQEGGGERVHEKSAGRKGLDFF